MEEKKPKRRDSPPKFKAGDKVEILKSKNESIIDAVKTMVGKVCEIKEVRDGILLVWQPDKKDYWAFTFDEVKLVKE